MRWFGQMMPLNTANNFDFQYAGRRFEGIVKLMPDYARNSCHSKKQLYLAAESHVNQGNAGPHRSYRPNAVP